MNRRIFLFISFVLIFFVHKAVAQQVLTVEEAVELALKNNYQIRMAANDLKVDETAVSPGRAGMLPKITGTLGDQNRVQNLTQVRSDGSKVSQDNAKNNNLNYGAGLDWTIFDGFKMFARYDQLKELEKLGQASLKQAILTTVSDVMITYYDLVQQQQQLSALDTTLMISNQRVEFAHNRFIIGKASKLDVLNAKVDLNTDQTLMQRQLERYANTKIKLNQSLARDTKIDFKVIDEILVDEKLFLPELEKLVQEQNPQLRAQLINKRIAELELKQTVANRYPSIVAGTGYNFGHTKSDLGFSTSSDSHGWNYGIDVSLNIFDGFNQNRNEKIGKIQIENAELAIAEQTQELLSQLGTAYQTYTTNISLIDLEGKNEAIAKENLEITVDKYRIGIITTVEFRTAQLNYINAKVRYYNAVYQAKLSEITLKELAGDLTL
ncbi:TolC family protein [Flavobacteriaceae bacterium F89]|uniref:TolC family protein n=1 Tax=Cerina litoralis TaxID=2874477 RepID=A0AAE3EVL1_9FLAO|nr:TolC family protein [Cerina litoralis]MCG2461885.1 TolC family protein [Cerina litoralis]